MLVSKNVVVSIFDDTIALLLEGERDHVWYLNGPIIVPLKYVGAEVHILLQASVRWRNVVLGQSGLP
jgi:hypothetical protein